MNTNQRLAKMALSDHKLAIGFANIGANLRALNAEPSLVAETERLAKEYHNEVEETIKLITGDDV
jgi:hypothetical protein